MAAPAKINLERTGDVCGGLFVGPLSLCRDHWDVDLANSRAMDTQHLVFLQRYFHRQATEGANGIYCTRADFSRAGHLHGCSAVVHTLAIAGDRCCIWRCRA